MNSDIKHVYEKYSMSMDSYQSIQRKEEVERLKNRYRLKSDKKITRNISSQKENGNGISIQVMFE